MREIALPAARARRAPFRDRRTQRSIRDAREAQSFGHSRAERLAEVKANETALCLRQEELESHLIAASGRQLARSCREGPLSA